MEGNVLGGVGAPREMRHAALFVALALAAAACKAGPVRSERKLAGDAGFEYRARPETSAGAIAPLDAGVRPAVVLVAGTPGGRGDLDGVGADARLGLVGGMARVDDAIVFADEGNASIRRFVPATRAVETIARMPAVEGGRPSLPAYVALDAKSRRLFVTDRSRHVVYALDLATSTLSLFAGRPSVRGDADGSAKDALFDAPTGLAFDGDHTLYVADVGSRRIRSIDVARGAVTTLARGFVQVWGLCHDGASLFATDNLNEALFRVDPKTGASTLVAGSNRFGYAGPTDGLLKVARFREPRGLTCANGVVYVADRGNGAVRRVDATTVKTIAGTAGETGHRDGYATQSLFGDVQSVLAWDDTLYVGDEATLRAVSLRDEAVTTVAGAASQAVVEKVSRGPLVKPESVYVSLQTRAAYVTNCGDATVQRIDVETHAESVFAGEPLNFGFLDGSGGDARFDCPSAIGGDGRGNLFVGDRANHAVRAIDEATRRVVTIAGTPSRCGNDDGSFETATVCEPTSIAFAHGAIYVADAGTSTIRRIDVAARTVSTLAGTPFVRGHADGAQARFSSPAAIVLVGDALYVADQENHVVRRVDLQTGAVTTLAGAPGEAGSADGPPSSARFTRPRALAAVGDALLVFDATSVRRVPLGGGDVTRVLGTGRGVRLGSVAPSLSRPVAAVGIAPGDVLVVDRAESALLRLLY